MRDKPPRAIATPAPEGPDGYYLDPPTAAAYLGIATRTLRQWTTARRIEFIRAGRLTKYTKAALDRFMREHTIAPGKRR